MTITADQYIIDSTPLFHRFKDYVNKVQPTHMVLDVETDSVSEKTAKLYGIGICFNEQTAFYITWRNHEGEEIWDWKSRQFIAAYLGLLAKDTKVIGHNIIYDTLVLENNLGIDISPYIYSDTILQKHTLEEEPPFALKEIAVYELGDWADKAQERLKESVLANGGTWKKDAKDMYLAETSILGEYCMWDVLITYKLFKIYEERLAKENLLDLFYADEIMPLYREVTIDMKRKGFPVDVPYYENLKEELIAELAGMQKRIMDEIKPLTAKFVSKLLNKEHPVKATGNFPKLLGAYLGIPLPVQKKTGKVTLARKAVEAQKAAGCAKPMHEDFYNWLLGENVFPTSIPYGSVEHIQEKMYLGKKDRVERGRKYVFNLGSGDHMAALLFKELGIKPRKFTDGGKKGIPKPATDAEVLDEVIAVYQEEHPFLSILLDYRKLGKLLSTYVLGILDRQIDGMIYTSMLQFGTTSGRYSSRNPNLQNQPRIKDEDSGLSPLVLKYVNAIRYGFVAPPGFKVVNADFSQLEPMCFAHMSGDPKLQDVFNKKHDLYSQIAIDVFTRVSPEWRKMLKDVSADKKADNYLKKVYPEFRQKAKIFCLAVVYGAEESRIKQSMGCSWKEAKKIIKAYLSAYPNLKKYMRSCNDSAKNTGMVRTEFGRVRHLAAAATMKTLYGDKLIDYEWAQEKGLTEQRRKFKNLLNNAKNFPIQGLAAHIVNRAMINCSREFKKNNIDGWIGLQVHDEITCIIREDQAKLAGEILQDSMENTTLISVPLIAEPLIADNWGEAK